jgi:hypothetical protein
MPRGLGRGRGKSMLGRIGKSVALPKTSDTSAASSARKSAFVSRAPLVDASYGCTPYGVNPSLVRSAVIVAPAASARAGDYVDLIRKACCRHAFLSKYIRPRANSYTRPLISKQSDPDIIGAAKSLLIDLAFVGDDYAAVEAKFGQFQDGVAAVELDLFANDRAKTRAYRRLGRASDGDAGAKRAAGEVIFKDSIGRVITDEVLPAAKKYQAAVHGRAKALSLLTAPILKELTGEDLRSFEVDWATGEASLADVANLLIAFEGSFRNGEEAKDAFMAQLAAFVTTFQEEINRVGVYDDPQTKIFRATAADVLVDALKKLGLNVDETAIKEALIGGGDLVGPVRRIAATTWDTRSRIKVLAAQQTRIKYCGCYEHLFNLERGGELKSRVLVENVGDAHAQGGDVFYPMQYVAVALRSISSEGDIPDKTSETQRITAEVDGLFREDAEDEGYKISDDPATATTQRAAIASGIRQVSFTEWSEHDEACYIGALRGLDAASLFATEDAAIANLVDITTDEGGITIALKGGTEITAANIAGIIRYFNEFNGFSDKLNQLAADARTSSGINAADRLVCSHFIETYKAAFKEIIAKLLTALGASGEQVAAFKNGETTPQEVEIAQIRADIERAVSTDASKALRTQLQQQVRVISGGVCLYEVQHSHDCTKALCVKRSYVDEEADGAARQTQTPAFADYIGGQPRVIFNGTLFAHQVANKCTADVSGGLFAGADALDNQVTAWQDAIVADRQVPYSGAIDAITGDDAEIIKEELRALITAKCKAGFTKVLGRPGEAEDAEDVTLTLACGAAVKTGLHAGAAEVNRLCEANLLFHFEDAERPADAPAECPLLRRRESSLTFDLGDTIPAGGNFQDRILTINNIRTLQQVKASLAAIATALDAELTRVDGLIIDETVHPNRATLSSHAAGVREAIARAMIALGLAPGILRGGGTVAETMEALLGAINDKVTDLETAERDRLAEVDRRAVAAAEVQRAAGLAATRRDAIRTAMTRATQMMREVLHINARMRDGEGVDTSIFVASGVAGDAYRNALRVDPLRAADAEQIRVTEFPELIRGDEGAKLIARFHLADRVVCICGGDLRRRVAFTGERGDSLDDLRAFVLERALAGGVLVGDEQARACVLYACERVLGRDVGELPLFEEDGVDRIAAIDSEHGELTVNCVASTQAGLEAGCGLVTAVFGASQFEGADIMTRDAHSLTFARVPAIDVTTLTVPQLQQLSASLIVIRDRLAAYFADGRVPIPEGGHPGVRGPVYESAVRYAILSALRSLYDITGLGLDRPGLSPDTTVGGLIDPVIKAITDRLGAVVRESERLEAAAAEEVQRLTDVATRIRARIPQLARTWYQEKSTFGRLLFFDEDRVGDGFLTMTAAGGVAVKVSGYDWRPEFQVAMLGGIVDGYPNRQVMVNSFSVADNAYITTPGDSYTEVRHQALRTYVLAQLAEEFSGDYQDCFTYEGGYRDAEAPVVVGLNAAIFGGLADEVALSDATIATGCRAVAIDEQTELAMLTVQSGHEGLVSGVAKVTAKASAILATSRTGLRNAKLLTCGETLDFTLLQADDVAVVDADAPNPNPNTLARKLLRALYPRENYHKGDVVKLVGEVIALAENLVRYITELETDLGDQTIQEQMYRRGQLKVAYRSLNQITDVVVTGVGETTAGTAIARSGATGLIRELNDVEEVVPLAPIAATFLEQAVDFARQWYIQLAQYHKEPFEVAGDVADVAIFGRAADAAAMPFGLRFADTIYRISLRDQDQLQRMALNVVDMFPRSTFIARGEFEALEDREVRDDLVGYVMQNLQRVHSRCFENGALRPGVLVEAGDEGAEVTVDTITDRIKRFASSPDAGPEPTMAKLKEARQGAEVAERSIREKFEHMGILKQPTSALTYQLLGDGTAKGVVDMFFRESSAEIGELGKYEIIYGFIMQHTGKLRALIAETFSERDGLPMASQLAQREVYTRALNALLGLTGDNAINTRDDIPGINSKIETSPVLGGLITEIKRLSLEEFKALLQQNAGIAFRDSGGTSFVPQCILADDEDGYSTRFTSGERLLVAATQAYRLPSIDARLVFNNGGIWGFCDDFKAAFTQDYISKHRVRELPPFLEEALDAFIATNISPLGADLDRARRAAASSEEIAFTSSAGMIRWGRDCDSADAAAESRSFGFGDLFERVDAEDGSGFSVKVRDDVLRLCSVDDEDIGSLEVFSGELAVLKAQLQGYLGRSELHGGVYEEMKGLLFITGFPETAADSLCWHGFKPMLEKAIEALEAYEAFVELQREDRVSRESSFSVDSTFTTSFDGLVKILNQELLSRMILSTGVRKRTRDASPFVSSVLQMLKTQVIGNASGFKHGRYSLPVGLVPMGYEGLGHLSYEDFTVVVRRLEADLDLDHVFNEEIFKSRSLRSGLEHILKDVYGIEVRTFSDIKENFELYRRALADYVRFIGQIYYGCPDQLEPSSWLGPEWDGFIDYMFGKPEKRGIYDGSGCRVDPDGRCLLVKPIVRDRKVVRYEYIYFKPSRDRTLSDKLTRDGWYLIDSDNHIATLADSGRVVKIDESYARERRVVDPFKGVVFGAEAFFEPESEWRKVYALGLEKRRIVRNVTKHFEECVLVHGVLKDGQDALIRLNEDGYYELNVDNMDAIKEEFKRRLSLALEGDSVGESFIDRCLDTVLSKVASRILRMNKEKHRQEEEIRSRASLLRAEKAKITAVEKEFQAQIRRIDDEKNNETRTYRSLSIRVSDKRSIISKREGVKLILDRLVSIFVEIREDPQFLLEAKGLVGAMCNIRDVTVPDVRWDTIQGLINRALAYITRKKEGMDSLILRAEEVARRQVYAVVPPSPPGTPAPPFTPLAASSRRRSSGAASIMRSPGAVLSPSPMRVDRRGAVRSMAIADRFAGLGLESVSVIEI